MVKCGKRWDLCILYVLRLMLIIFAIIKKNCKYFILLQLTSDLLLLIIEQNSSTNKRLLMAKQSKFASELFCKSYDSRVLAYFLPYLGACLYSM